MSTPIENNTEELRNILQQVNELPNAGNTPLEAVLYVEQTLTDEQKAQARQNIGAAAPGESGENGATFTPYVDSAGNLSWSNDKGLANPSTVNIMGPAYTLTDTDKAAITASVLNRLPTWTGGSY